MAPKQGNSDSHMAGSQLLQLLHTDETEQKAPDVEIEILCGRDCGLWVLRELPFPLDVAVIFLQELRSL